MRIIKSHREQSKIQRGQPIQIMINGKPTKVFEGEMVVAVLLAERIHQFRQTNETKIPRELYCGMGICSECMVTVDGVKNFRTCQKPVVDGMEIETHIERY